MHMLWTCTPCYAIHRICRLCAYLCRCELRYCDEPVSAIVPHLHAVYWVSISHDLVSVSMTYIDQVYSICYSFAECMIQSYNCMCMHYPDC